MYGLDLIAAHMVGDYILQTDHMARNKFQDWKIRALHVTLYALPFLLLMCCYEASVAEKAIFMGLLWLTHFVTDSRCWASAEKWPPKPILVDQAIHIATLAVIARVLI